MEKNLKESQLILQYALFQRIPQKRYSSSEDFSTLYSIADEAFSVCQKFLADGSPVLMGSNEESNQQASLFHTFEFSSRWKQIFMDDAITRWYIATRDFISDNCNNNDSGSADGNNYSSTIRMPSAMRYAYDWTTEGNRNKRIQGLEYLLEYGKVKINDNCTFQINEIERYDNEIEKKINRDNSWFGKKLSTINNSLNDRCAQHLEILKCEPVPRTGVYSGERKINRYSVKLGKLEYIAALAKPRSVEPLTAIPIVDGKQPATVNGEWTKSKYEKYLECCKTISLSLKSDRMKKADQIYAKAKLEEEFGLYLSNCLYKNIISINVDGSCPFNPSDVQKLADAFQLPNFFTRTLFVNSAFNDLKAELKRHASCDKCRKGYRYCDEQCPSFTEFEKMQNKKVCSHKRIDDDFFSILRSECLGSVVSKQTPSSPVYDSVYGWLELYKRAMYYLANFILPIYESIFIVALYNSIRIHFKSSKSAKQNAVSEHQILVEIFRYLGGYLNKEGIYDALEIPVEKEPHTKGNSYTTEELLDLVNTVSPDFSADYSEKEHDLYKACIQHSKRTAEIKAPISNRDLPKLFPHQSDLMKHAVLDFVGITTKTN